MPSCAMDHAGVLSALTHALRPEAGKQPVPKHVLARIAFLIGDAAPRYAEANINLDPRDPGGLTGNVAVLTDLAVCAVRLLNVMPVINEPCAPGEPGGATVVDVWPRRNLCGISLNETPDANINQGWNRAGRLPETSRIKLTYSGGQKLDLPLDKYADDTKRLEVAALMPSLQADLLA